MSIESDLIKKVEKLQRDVDALKSKSYYSEWQIITGGAYVSSTSFTAPTDLTSVLVYGTKLKISQAAGVFKYFTVQSSSYSAGTGLTSVVVIPKLLAEVITNTPILEMYWSHYLYASGFPSYEPVYQNYGSVINRFLALPELRALWPFSSVNESGNVYDISGQGRILTNNGTATRSLYNFIVPYMSFNGSSQYLSRADEAGLDITGNLTMGGWFYFNALGTANQEGLLGKHNTTGSQRSYAFYLNTSNGIVFQVSVNGGFGAGNANTIDSAALQTGKWYFVVARFTPSTELALFVNNVKTTNTTSVVASIFNSTAAFEIMRRNVALTYTNGLASLCFVTASALSDVLISELYNSTRGLFGV